MFEEREREREGGRGRLRGLSHHACRRRREKKNLSEGEEEVIAITGCVHVCMSACVCVR